MLDRIIHAEARAHLVLFVRFEDGTEGEVDLTDFIRGPMFEPLRDPAFFAQVRVADHGVPEWPNGLDLAPDALHEIITRRAVA